MLLCLGLADWYSQMEKKCGLLSSYYRYFQYDLHLLVRPVSCPSPCGVGIRLHPHVPFLRACAVRIPPHLHFFRSCKSSWSVLWLLCSRATSKTRPSGIYQYWWWFAGCFQV